MNDHCPWHNRRCRRTSWLVGCLFAICLPHCLPQNATAANPLLPDLFSWENEILGYMHGGEFDLNSEPSRVLYRFDTAIPNQGIGPFEVFEITHPNHTQDVYQNIYDDEGGVTRRWMASFPDVEAPSFGHLHLEGMARYSLREVTDGDGVGPMVATHLKTSHALVDSVGYDLFLPGAPLTRVYNSPLSNPLGVSIGWADLYSKSIPKQRIDVTGIADGRYWLEVIVDPFDLIQETDETNNTTRILVELTVPDPLLQAADFEEDGDVDRFDLEQWQSGFGNTHASHMQGDADHDHDTDGADFLIWQRQFTPAASPTFAGSTTVPEPSPLTLLMGITALTLAGRTRAR